MAEKNDITIDPIERLNNFLNKNFSKSLKNNIKVEEENVIIEINDLEISLINDLFKKLPIKFPVKIDELEDRIIFAKKNAAELLRYLQEALQQSTTPQSTTVLHSFTPNKQEPSLLAQLEHERKNRERDEEAQRIMEYSRIPRKTLYTTDHEQTPQFIAKKTSTRLGNFAISLERYIKSELKNPNSHGHLWGLVGSDQVIKKNIAQHILTNLTMFSKMDLSDPNYAQSKRHLMQELDEAITKNRQAHGFWASLSGPGKLEEILIAAKTTLEPKDFHKKPSHQ